MGVKHGKMDLEIDFYDVQSYVFFFLDIFPKQERSLRYTRKGLIPTTETYGEPSLPISSSQARRASSE